MISKITRIFVPLVIACGALVGCATINNGMPLAKLVTTPTPGAGQLPIGLLNAEKISSLPEGDVKNSLQTELSSVKAECVSIPGCMGDTVQIYRVIVPDNAYSIRFADFKTENEAEHTEILSMMDGKTQETTTIQKDLLAKEAVIDGVPTKAFGYVDDLGNSHYIFVDQGENKYLFDAEQNPYKVVTQNEKEVQAYSSFWDAPIVAEAASLPTPTAEVVPTEATPTQEVTESNKDKMVVEKMVTDFFNKEGDFSDEKIVELALSPYGIKETGMGIYSLGYGTGVASSQCILFDIRQDESFRYYLMGSIDQNGKRFVFVMKNILEDNIMAKVNKSKFMMPGDNPKTFFIDSEEKMNYLLELYQGKPVIAHSAFGNMANTLEDHLKDDPSRTTFLLKAIEFINVSSPLTENLFQRLKNLSPDSISTTMPSDKPDYILSDNGQFSVDSWESFSGLAPEMGAIDLREDTGNW